MDRQLAERMVGAACLLAVLVLVVPAILDGSDGRRRERRERLVGRPVDEVAPDFGRVLVGAALAEAAARACGLLFCVLFGW